MPEHCYYCFWNFNCPLWNDEPDEDEYLEAEECGGWMINVA